MIKSEAVVYIWLWSGIRHTAANSSQSSSLVCYQVCLLMGFFLSRWWELQLQEGASRAPPPPNRPLSPTTRSRDSSELWEWTNGLLCVNVRTIGLCHINTEWYGLFQTHWICHCWNATGARKGAHQHTLKGQFSTKIHFLNLNWSALSI